MDKKGSDPRMNAEEIKALMDKLGWSESKLSAALQDMGAKASQWAVHNWLTGRNKPGGAASLALRDLAEKHGIKRARQTV